MAEAMTQLQQQTHQPDPESQKINTLTTRERSVIACLAKVFATRRLASVCRSQTRQCDIISVPFSESSG